MAWIAAGTNVWFFQFFRCFWRRGGGGARGFAPLAAASHDDVLLAKWGNRKNQQRWCVCGPKCSKRKSEEENKIYQNRVTTYNTEEVHRVRTREPEEEEEKKKDRRRRRKGR